MFRESQLTPVVDSETSAVHLSSVSPDCVPVGVDRAPIVAANLFSDTQ